MNLKDKVTDWLRKQGYPLEMRAAAALQAAGFRVTISDFYHDVELDKRREIDITAMLKSAEGRSTSLQVALCVECKLSAEKPWVVFMSDTQDDYWFPPFHLLTSELYYHFLCHALEETAFSRTVSALPLMQSRLMGHGISQALRGNEGADIPYQACMGAVKSAIAIVAGTNRRDKEIEERLDLPYLCCIAFPVVVIGSPLFEAYLAPNGEIRLEEVEESVVCWKAIEVKGMLTSSVPVHIVTEPHLGKFAQDARMTAGTLIEVTYSQEELLEAIAQQLE